MKISIIIPCFNVEQYLARCVDSVLSQSYSNFELLLVDDGSKDATAQIAIDYTKKDDRVQYFYQNNAGVSNARNLGIEKAIGDKIVFIDADDYVDSDILMRLKNAMEDEDSGAISICGMNHVKKGIVSKNDNYLKLLHQGKTDLNKNEIVTLFDFENLSSPCCKLYNSEILKINNVRFNAAITYQEDLIFNLDYFRYVNKTILVPSFDYYYIENETSSSLKYHENLFDSLPIIFNQLESYPDFKNRKEYSRTFFFNQILNNLNNYSHFSSDLTFFERVNKVKAILNSDIYNFSKPALNSSPINFVLKFLISFKSYIGIVIFYKLYRVLK